MAGGIRTVKIRFTGDNDLGKTVASVNKTLGKINDGVKSAAASIPEMLLSGLKAPVLIAGVAIAGAALGSILGAALAAAIPLALGGGALALGIKSVANDPAVKSAWGDLTKNAKSIFDDFGKAFKGPVLEAIKVFNKTLTEMKPTFMAISQATAPLVTLLAPALAAMAKNSLPGIKSAIEASVPLFTILAEEAPKLATAFSEFLTEVTSNGPQAAQFLKDFFTVLINFIKVSGKVISWLANEYVRTRTTIIAVVKAVTAAWNGFVSFFKGVGTKVGSAIGSLINAYNNFRNRVISVWDSIVNKIEGAVNRIASLWNWLRNLASSAINFSVGGLSSFFGGARASGGPVTAGKTYLVGEKGPELFTADRSGYIAPNNALGSGGPQTIILEADFGNGVKQSFQFEITEYARGVKRGVQARG
jgi:hypothetical protein